MANFEPLEVANARSFVKGILVRAGIQDEEDTASEIIDRLLAKGVVIPEGFTPRD